MQVNMGEDIQAIWFSEILEGKSHWLNWYSKNLECLAENHMAFPIFWNPSGFFAKPFGFPWFRQIFPYFPRKMCLFTLIFIRDQEYYTIEHMIWSIFFMKNPLILMEGFFSRQNLQNPWNLPNLRNLRNPWNPYGFSKGNI